MGNMGYCRFVNTHENLLDCQSHMDDDDISEPEKEERLKLIKLCRDIAQDYEGEIE